MHPSVIRKADHYNIARLKPHPSAKSSSVPFIWRYFTSPWSFNNHTFGMRSSALLETFATPLHYSRPHFFIPIPFPFPSFPLRCLFFPLLHLVVHFLRTVSFLLPCMLYTQRFASFRESSIEQIIYTLRKKINLFGPKISLFLFD